MVTDLAAQSHSEEITDQKEALDPVAALDLEVTDQSEDKEDLGLVVTDRLEEDKETLDPVVTLDLEVTDLLEDKEASDLVVTDRSEEDKETSDLVAALDPVVTDRSEEDKEGSDPAVTLDPVVTDRLEEKEALGQMATSVDKEALEATVKDLVPVEVLEVPTEDSDLVETVDSEAIMDLADSEAVMGPVDLEAVMDPVDLEAVDPVDLNPEEEVDPGVLVVKEVSGITTTTSGLESGNQIEDLRIRFVFQVID